MSTHIPLPARVGLKAAGPLKEAFLSATAPVTIDAKDVEMLGAQGLQILIAGQQHIAQTGGQVTLSNPSEAFLSCLHHLGATLSHITTSEIPL